MTADDARKLLMGRPAMMVTLHQLQRLVAGSVDIDGLSLDQVALRIMDSAALHAAETGCEERRATVAVLSEMKVVP